jgi:hypothetical protein
MPEGQRIGTEASGAGGTTRAIDLEKLITRFDVPARGTALIPQHEPTARLEGV